MADAVDLAQQLEEMQRDQALHAQLARAATTPREPQLGRVCLDCGDRIPMARQLAVPGCRRCVDCEGGFQRAQTHFRAA